MKNFSGKVMNISFIRFLPDIINFQLVKLEMNQVDPKLKAKVISILHLPNKIFFFYYTILFMTVHKAKGILDLFSYQIIG